MAQAISNKVLVQSAKYCWMICDYSISGSTLSYSISFYYEGGCAQLDNAWIKVGGTDVWRNSGRVHNYDGNPYQSPHTVQIHSGTATISGSKQVTFGVTKYQNVAVSGSFTVTGGSAPSNLSVTDLSTTWNTVTGTYSVGNWGGLSAGYMAARVFGSTGTARLENQFNGQSTVTTTVTNSSVPLDGGITIKGCGTYKVDLYASNSAGANNTSDVTVYTPPAPSQFTYTDPGGSGTKTYSIVFSGVAANNNTTYDSASLTRYVRYKTNEDDWTVVEADVVKAIDATTVFTVSVPAGGSATVEGWMTYYGQKSEVVSIALTNDNPTCALYGSVDDSARRIVKIYGSVNGQRKKMKSFYGAVNNTRKKIFESFEVVYGKVVYYTDDTYTTTAVAYLQKSDCDAGLVALTSEDDMYQVNGVQFPAKRLKEFTYGKFWPNYTPWMFLAYATHLDTINDIPASVANIRGNYMQHCEIYNHPVVIPPTVKTIGINFLDSCFSLNSPVTLQGTDTVVSGGFLNKMRDMVSTVTINSPADNFTNTFVYPSLSSVDENSPAYTTGITVKCPTSAATQAFLTKFPNEDGGLLKCHRKLIAGN